MKRTNDIQHRRAFEKYYGRKIRPGYHIHHKDGDHTNNNPLNLVEVTAAEHYEIHKKQGDWAACILLAGAACIDAEELARVQHLHGKMCVERKVGIHSDEYNHSDRSRNMWKRSSPGRKPVTNEVQVLKFKTEEEVLFFLQANPEWRRGIPDNMKRGLRSSVRRITSEESKSLAQKRLKEGKHNFTIEYVCPVCGTAGKGPMMKRWHFYNCKKKRGINNGN